MRAIVILALVFAMRRSAWGMSRWAHPLRVTAGKPPASMHLVNPFPTTTIAPIAVLRGIAITALVTGVLGCNVAMPPVGVDAGVVDANGGPDHLPPVTPSDPSQTVIRLRPACDRLAGNPPPEACSLACSVGLDSPNLPSAFENAGILKSGECADFRCNLLGGGRFDFGVCEPL